ncbi:hypothetical protein ElyMa_002511000 [Elysia marginata]|uniref:Uncharacterized protein n=1 Tax=Elysia marginata TaxID=1093978 RepID=A0AAV4GRI5_9GAST|nr:hypothetical protein ElyMa_002511000 [Elysia marginata]
MPRKGPAAPDGKLANRRTQKPELASGSLCRPVLDGLDPSRPHCGRWRRSKNHPLPCPNSDGFGAAQTLAQHARV